LFQKAEKCTQIKLYEERIKVTKMYAKKKRKKNHKVREKRNMYVNAKKGNAKGREKKVSMRRGEARQSCLTEERVGANRLWHHLDSTTILLSKLKLNVMLRGRFQQQVYAHLYPCSSQKCKTSVKIFSIFLRFWDLRAQKLRIKCC